MLKFYNTLTRKKEIFKPIRKGIVHLYTCGPTVYDFAHIGNFRSYIFADLLKRYLEYKGFKVKQIMNITDIDDKTIKNSAKEGISLKEFTIKYTKAFFEDLKKLRIEPASKYPKATEHIKDMIEFTKVLVKKGYAYEKLHSVYYDISKFKDYGKLSRVDLSKMKPGARVDLDEYEKEHPGDFTLLKRSKLDELKRGIYYKTEFGNVRPGWHLECSVMSMKYLGENFDIHTGGTDLIFPHHENEIAQSEAYSGKKFVNYWLHNEHLVVEGKKMSKSLGNFYTLRDLLKKGYDTKAIRYILLATHYGQKLNFIFKGLEAAKNVVGRLNEFFNKVKEGKDSKEIPKLIKDAKEKFEKAMDDDLSVAKALAAIFDFVREVNKVGGGKKVYNFMKRIDKVLGILEEKEAIKISEDVKKLIEQREKARKDKNWKKADKIRTKLRENGILLEDTEKGVKVKVLK